MSGSVHQRLSGSSVCVCGGGGGWMHQRARRTALPRRVVCSKVPPATTPWVGMAGVGSTQVQSAMPHRYSLLVVQLRVSHALPLDSGRTPVRAGGVKRTVVQPGGEAATQVAKPYPVGDAGDGLCSQGHRAHKGLQVTGLSAA